MDSMTHEIGNWALSASSCCVAALVVGALWFYNHEGNSKASDCLFVWKSRLHSAILAAWKPLQNSATHHDPSSPANEPPQGDSQRRRSSRASLKCPFSSETEFYVETAEHLPPSPLDLQLCPQHSAIQWLAAGISGQDHPGLLRANLRRLRHADKHFLIPDDDDQKMAKELRLKQHHLDSTKHDEKFVMEPSSLPAQQEVLELILAYLPRCAPKYYEYHEPHHAVTVVPIQTTFLIDEWKSAPLELAARLVQEDLILMRPDPKEYCLAAAAVVFSFGGLPDKLGKPMEFIHAPVPGYSSQLQKTLQLLFRTMDPEKPLWRTNWGLAAIPDLDDTTFDGQEASVVRRQSSNTQKVRELDPLDLVKSTFVRVEYQTIRRLPQSRYLLFTVRTLVDPITAMEEFPTAANCMAKSLRGFSRPMREYKGIVDDDEIYHAMIEYLETIGASSDTST